MDVKKCGYFILKSDVLKIVTFSVDQFIPATKVNASVHSPPAACKPIRWLPKTAVRDILKIKKALFTGRLV